MYRPLLPASAVLLAVLTSLPAPAHADGMEPRPAGSHRAPAAFAPDDHRARPHLARRHHAWHPRYSADRRRFGMPGGFGPADDALAYGWLPRNLNLPIYNAPSEGPSPTL